MLAVLLNSETNSFQVIIKHLKIIFLNLYRTTQIVLEKALQFLLSKKSSNPNLDIIEINLSIIWEVSLLIFYCNSFQKLIKIEISHSNCLLTINHRSLFTFQFFIYTIVKTKNVKKEAIFYSGTE